ncbi:MAG: S1C family serine protease [Rhodospirillales bacterium]
MLATWAADNCFSGYGRGADQNGNKLEMWYDASVGLVQGQVATLDARKAGFPSLPPVAKSGSASPPSGGGGSTGTGSGFFITDDGYFVTNHHVVERAVRISVRTPDGKWRPARLLREDASNDLAIGTIDSPSYALPLGLTRDLRRGDDLVVLGYPLPRAQGQEQKAVFGRINAVNGSGDDVRYFQMDAPIQHGNSGGPVINVFGEVIGVATKSLVGAKGLNQPVTDVHYAVKPAYIMPMVRAEGVQDKVRLSGRGRQMSMVDIAERLKDGVILILVEK